MEKSTTSKIRTKWDRYVALVLGPPLGVEVIDIDSDVTNACDRPVRAFLYQVH